MKKKKIKITKKEVISIMDDALRQMYDAYEDDCEDKETKDLLLKIDYIFNNYEDWLKLEEIVGK